ncbi:MAG: hypothetical protein HOC77_07055 [Chloroflexi bacterium]|nr:hypothetical protein [Chloroflexota bacterium]MBT4514834.1 hypothetical protein [Chloroflexota bacterium]
MSTDPSVSMAEFLTQAQHCLANMPVLITGSGASAPYGIPTMPALATHISETVTLTSPRGPEFLELLENKGLEPALDVDILDTSDVAQIVTITREHIEEADLKAYFIQSNIEPDNGLSRCFRLLLNTTHTSVDVVTTNYDRIAEYCAEFAGYVATNTFNPGYVRRHRPDAESAVFLNGQRVSEVRVWKVHGSVDWYRDHLGRSFGSPFYPTHDSVEPLIVIPGLKKYQEPFKQPFSTIFTGANEALREARAFLTIGYGFNDFHIQAGFVDRAREERVPIVILAKELTDAAKRFIESLGDTPFCAIESCDGGSVIYSAKFPTGARIPGKELWSLDGFLDAAFDGGV